MQLPAFDTNIVVISVLVVAGLYGLMGGKHRLRLLILSTYVGVVLAEQMAGLVKPYLGMLSGSQVAWLLLGLPILFFGFSRGSHDHKGSAIANLIVGLLAGALILSSGLHLLPTSEQSQINGDSFLAMQLGTYHLWLLGLLPLVAVIMGLFKPREKKHH